MKKDAAICAALILAVALSFVAFYTAPCGLWKYSRVADMPARCVMEGK